MVATRRRCGPRRTTGAGRGTVEVTSSAVDGTVIQRHAAALGVSGSGVASNAGMDRYELLSLAMEMLAEAVGDLLREEEDPRAWIFTAAHADSPVGELLLHRHATAGEDAVCVMLPVDVLSRILEAHAFDAATGARLAAWLADPPASEQYRVVAIGRDGIAAVTLDTTAEIEEEAPISLVRH